jgi:hypothetical protein
MILFQPFMKKRSERIGENMIAAAQKWSNEGLDKGVVKGQIEVIEKLLKAGVHWDFMASFILPQK